MAQYANLKPPAALGLGVNTLPLNLLKAYGLLRIAFSVLYLHTLTESHVLMNPLVYSVHSWAPASLAQCFGALPPPVSVVAVLGLTVIISTLLMGVGLFTRVAAPVACVSGILLMCLAFSFGKMTHNAHSLFIFLLIFQFSDWGTFFSVDSLLRGKRLPKIHGDAHPEYLIWIFLAVLSLPYFCSGFFKVLKGHFWDSGYINTIIVSKQILWGYFHPVPAANVWLKEVFLNNQWLGNGLAWLTLFVELAFFLVLTSPGTRVFMLAMAVAFHASITLTTRILFFEHMLMMGLMLGLCVYLYLNTLSPPETVRETGYIAAPTWKLPLGVFVFAFILMTQINHWAPIIGSQWTVENWFLFARALHAPFPVNSNYFESTFDLNAAWVLLGIASVIMGLFALRFIMQLFRLLKAIRPASQPTFIYDADCGFCQQSVGMLQKWGAAVTFVSNANSTELLKTVDVPFAETQRYALYLEQYQGKWVVHRGAAAMNAVFSRVPGGWPGLPLRLASVLYPIAGIQQLENGVYRWVADNRYWISKGTCSINPKI